MSNEIDLYSLVESLNLGIICQDKDYKIIYSNKAAEQILGLSKEQIYGLTSFDVRWKSIHEDGSSFPADTHPIVEALSKGILVEDVVMGVFISKYNDYRWIKVTGIPVFKDKQSLPVQAIAVFEDISDQLRLEKSLIDKEKVISNLIDYAPFGAHQYFLNEDHDLVFLYFNKSANKILGIDQSILLGKTIESAFPGLSKKLIQLYKNVALSGIPAHIEEVYYKDGKIKGVFDVYALQPSYGNVISFFIDVSEKNKAAEELKKLNQELEERVKERTRKLEIVNTELESFCNSVAHDFKDPLRAINGHAHKIQEDFSQELSPELNSILESINKSSMQLNKMLDSILFLNTISRRSLDISAVNLSSLAISIMQTLQAKNENKRINFACQEDMIVQGDYELLAVMLSNLLDNAWKYSLMKDSINIIFDYHKTNNIPSFRIIDQGIGFNMQYYKKLFKPFHRLHSSSIVEGLGIGLLIAQRIIQRHDGEIWLESKETEGTSLFFTINTIKNSISTCNV
jgi:PAS domain S-box-containing protein